MVDWHVSSDGRSCAFGDCEAGQINVDNVCVDCEDYTRPNDTGTECVRPTDCKAAERKYIHEDGTCGLCADYEIVVDDYSCKQAECQAREIMLKNGQCKGCAYNEKVS